MDPQTAKYIIDHYLGLLSFEERGPIQMTLAAYLGASLDLSNPINTQPNPIATKFYRKNGWLSDDQDSSDMLKMGQDQFYILIASKLKERYESEIFINNCPKCGKLCRTPLAKQCRYCVYDWH
ncbi:hypothetical protein SAMN05428988_6179 [Chitinophaga sp. YR573]|uniref:hypothetical protein n=1 Tax=Chitinophaga sp. YR573 TaxID=1881040 RepID=UPI0008BB9153|nr:hypothetical protein [Chitinophaga sp. YR573]SEW45929.1 hypothetical protein SAMN05428988_6179 [Chitinophaga sp. YR573]